MDVHKTIQNGKKPLESLFFKILDKGVQIIIITTLFFYFTADPEGPGFCAMVLTALAALLLVVTLPFSLCTCIKVVAEYERSVIFRLGRLRKGKCIKNKLNRVNSNHLIQFW